MLSPALLGICCLAVMAPALTKAVRRADGLTLLQLSQNNLGFLPYTLQHCALSRDCTFTTLNDIVKLGLQETSGVHYSNKSFLSNEKCWHVESYICKKWPVDLNQLAADDTKSTILVPRDTTKIYTNVKQQCSVGVLTPTIENSDLKCTMNEDISMIQERMGLLNANTSLDSDFKLKIDHERQCASPVDPEMPPKEFESVADIPVNCTMEPLVSPPGSPKSVSEDSGSTITATNPTAVTFAELEEARSSYLKAVLRAKQLLAQVRKLQIMQVDSHIVSQLKALVSYYQKLLSVPCQRQIKHNSLRRGKDSVDLKAELLQSKDVRNLSTAALVSLVRTLESSNSSGKLLQTHKSSLPHGESNSNEKVITKINLPECEEIKRVTNTYLTQVSHLQSTVDSDVTESSSGGESCDEFDGYDESKALNSTTIHKRAMWKWVIDRAAVASRWTWLQSQVSDLEYRLRQLAEVFKHARGTKGSVCFEELPASEDSQLIPKCSDSAILQGGSPSQITVKKTVKPVNGYLDHASLLTSNGYHTVRNVPPSPEQCLDIYPQQNAQLSSTEVSAVSSCSRTRPFKATLFRKRKLLRTTGLHLVSRKAARLSSVKCSCNCQAGVMPCTLCGGRYNNIQSVDPDTMPLLERIALLEPSFHPVLSFEQDIPLSLHYENILKTSETYYHVAKPGPSITKKPRLGVKPKSLTDPARKHNRKLTRYAAQALLTSAKYRRNKNAARGSGARHIRTRGIIFKKWRGLHRGTQYSRNRMRRLSAFSSGSSKQDSPVHCPSEFEDGNGMFLSGCGREHLQDMMRKRHDEFDIDNVIIPYNIKTASSFKKLQYKEIIIPNWRVYEDPSPTTEENGPIGIDDELMEDISDETIVKRHDKMELEERKQVRGGALRQPNAAGGRRGRRSYRYDSRADSSGANTPDPVPFYSQDIMFQDSQSVVADSPSSPAMSPPPTPSSMNAMSDDSQPSGTINPAPRIERRRTVSLTKRDRSTEDITRIQIHEYVYHPPFEKRTFPLPDKDWEEMFKDSPHLSVLPESEETSLKDPCSPGSPASSSSTSSALEEEDDITDPEWTVVRRQNGSDQTLVLKLAKR